MLVVLAAGCSHRDAGSAAQPQSGNLLNLYIWADDMAPDTISTFEELTHIKVNVSYFDSPESLEARMLAGNSGFDVVVPTEAFIKRHIRSGAYLPLDKTKLPNLKNLDPVVMARVASQDPGNEHGVVYTWGTFGIGFNRKLVAQAVPQVPFTSWRVLFDPAIAVRLASCGINIFDDPEAVIREVLIYLGKDPNSPSAQDFDDAEKTLQRIRPYIRNIDTSSDIQALANGDICVALAYNGNVVQARRRAAETKNGVQIEYLIPEEGTLLWFDLFAIPRDAPHASNAYTFINYMMDPGVIAKVTNHVGFANANLAATPLVDPAVASDQAVYPNQEGSQYKLIAQSEYSPEQTRIVTRMWQRFKTQQ